MLWDATLPSASERKKRCAKSEARFRDYAETASDWFWEMGPDYKVTRQIGNAFGPKSSVRVGTAPGERAVDVDTEPEKWRALRETMDLREPFRDFAYLTNGSDGSPMYVRASGKPVFDASGEFLGYRGTDKTRRRSFAHREALRESERKFRDYAETASDWFWEIGPDYRFTLLTENAFGSDPAKRIGTACWDHALDLETELEKWLLASRKSLDAREPFRDFVYRVTGAKRPQCM